MYLAVVLLLLLLLLLHSLLFSGYWCNERSWPSSGAAAAVGDRQQSGALVFFGGKNIKWSLMSAIKLAQLWSTAVSVHTYMYIRVPICKLVWKYIKHTYVCMYAGFSCDIFSGFCRLFAQFNPQGNLKYIYKFLRLIYVYVFCMYICVLQ